MASLNEVQLLGYVGSDVKAIMLGDNNNSNTKVYNFSLSTNFSWKDKKGETQSRTEWHNIVSYNNKACDYLKKGAMCFVKGSIRYEEYTTKDGLKKNITKIIAEKILILDKKQSDNKYDKKEQSNIEKDTSLEDINKDFGDDDAVYF